MAQRLMRNSIHYSAESRRDLDEIWDYIVFYRAVGSDVYIDRILYGRSNYMSVLFKDIHHE